jgi:hypothetical protein
MNPAAFAVAVRQLPIGVNLTKETRGCVVAATVPIGLRQARPNRRREAIGSPGLNAQSPSQRSDGDCVLRSGTPVSSIRCLTRTYR